MRKLLSNRWLHIVVLIFLLLSAIHFNSSENDLRNRLQYATFDTYNKFNPRQPLDQVFIADLDEQSLKAMGQWPWPRTKIAKLVESLKNLGVKVIAFDMVFGEPDRTSPQHIVNDLPEMTPASVLQSLKSMPNNDEVFSKTILSAGNVVTGFTAAPQSEIFTKPYQPNKIQFIRTDQKEFLKNADSVKGIAENIDIFSRAAAGNGSFIAKPDSDGILRKVPILIKYPDRDVEGNAPILYPILGLEALRVGFGKQESILIKHFDKAGFLDLDYILKIGPYEVPLNSDGEFWVYYRHLDPKQYISIKDFFDPAQQDRLKTILKDKIVFIGASAQGLRDIRSTPLDLFVPGVEVHVNMVEQILQNKFLKRPVLIKTVEAMIIGVVGFLIIVFAPFMNAIILGFMTSGLICMMFAGSYQMYKSMGILIDPVYSSIVIFTLFLASTLLSYMRSEYERGQVRQAFGLYISPAFMQELTENPEKLKLGGEVRDLSVMFSDIRSFTTISERLSPEELIQLMNDFLTPMSDLVMANRGTIDKYMGDAMMAFWNAPLDDPDHARHACLAALKMQDALAPVNEAVKARAEKEGHVPVLLKAGIGINTGPCSVGNMGSRQRFAYSALGDAVNLASRLEGQTKNYGVNILVGEETYRQASDFAMLELDLLRVKGKEDPVRVYALLGDAVMAEKNEFKQWQVAHNAMLAAYRVLDLSCAAQELKTARDASAGRIDAFYDVYAARIATFIKTPPAEGWDGVFVASDK